MVLDFVDKHKASQSKGTKQCGGRVPRSLRGGYQSPPNKENMCLVPTLT